MPSDPKAASSSAASRPSSSSARPSSSSSAKPSSSSSSDPKKSSSSSSSSSASRPSSSSSSGGSTSSSSAAAKPTQPTANISANAWMSFFLFVCLVLIILQGPLGLSGTGSGLVSMNGFGFGLGGLPGCGGYVAAAMPWCAPAPAPVTAMPYTPIAPVAPVMPIQAMYQAPQPQVVLHAPPRYPSPQMGGQGYVASPQGGGGYSWYANPYPNQGGRYRRPPPPMSVQYQRPGMQVQVETGMLCWYFPYACQPLIPYAYARDSPPANTYHRPYNVAEYPLQLDPGGRGSQVQVQHQGSNPLQPVAMPVTPPISPEFVAGLANLEAAFYPLLVGAIALLVIFDYAS